jgi:hypothetical protein
MFKKSFIALIKQTGTWWPGLPDGFFSNQKSPLGIIWECLRLENVDIFYGHFGIFYIQTFGIFHDHLVHFVFIWCIFSGFGIMYQEKFGHPGCGPAAEWR